MIDLAKLTKDISAAEQQARDAAKKTPDVGSMSADMVHVPVGNSYPIKRRSSRVRKALGGASVIEREQGIWRGYLILPSAGGVASSRLAACVAMAAALKSYGATVYYRRD